jgi:hypothetical protein
MAGIIMATCRVILVLAAATTSSSSIVLLAAKFRAALMDRQQKLAEIGSTYADTMFHEFVEHPEYQGPNFTWDNFPNLAARMATVSVFMYFSDTEQLTQGDEAVAAEAARTTAIKLIKQHIKKNN